MMKGEQYGMITTVVPWLNGVVGCLLVLEFVYGFWSSFVFEFAWKKTLEEVFEGGKKCSLQ